jgi:hypothetical protein
VAPAAAMVRRRSAAPRPAPSKRVVRRPSACPTAAVVRPTRTKCVPPVQPPPAARTASRASPCPPATGRACARRPRRCSA